MKALRVLLARLRAMTGASGATGDDFADEVKSHLALDEESNVRAGMAPADARRLARAKVGSLTALEQAHRDQRRFRPLDAAARDLRHALRLLWRSPLFTFVAVLLLALGIGANTTIFTIANALILRDLPVRAPDRLALIANDSWTFPIFDSLRGQDLGVDGIGGWSMAATPVQADRGGRAEPANLQYVSGGLFEVMGASPMVGRTIDVEDDRRGGGRDGPVAVVSHAFWQARLGGDPDVLSRSITVEGVSLAVVGVMGPGFTGPEVGQPFDVAVPFGVEPLIRGQASLLDQRLTWWLSILVRLAPGQTFEAATQRLRAVQPIVRAATMPPRYSAEHRQHYLAEPFDLVPAANGTSPLRGRYRQPLNILAMTAVLVLGVACANLANLLLARGAARRAEMSMRQALGASRPRLVGQLLVEGLLLASLGALAGLGVAWVSSRGIMALLSTADRPVRLDLAFDWRVIAFTAATAGATAVLCALIPALRSTRTRPSEAMREQSRSVAGDGRMLTTHTLMAAQVALSLALVVVAGLLVRTFTTLAGQPLGFDPSRILVADVQLGRDAVTGDARAAYARQLQAVAAAVPGVAAAATSSFAPMSGASWNALIATVDGRTLPGTDRERIVWQNAVGAEFFRTYGIPLRAGRLFSDSDTVGAPPVAIVNDAFVERYLSGSDPIGRVVSDGSPDSPPRLIVGRVADARYFRDLRREAPATLYLSHQQLDDVGGRVVVSVRASDDRLEPLRQALVRGIEGAGQPVSIRTQRLTDYVHGALSQERLVATVAGFFGGLALLIAGVGLYGVAAYGVNRRRAELGIRLTLGARPAQIVQLVLSRLAWVVGLGVTAGSVLALWLGTSVQSLLHGVEPSDPRTLAWSAITLGATGAVAAMVPAWRAARTDPATVLREH